MKKLVLIIYLFSIQSALALNSECQKVINIIEKKIDHPKKEFIALNNWFIFYNILKNKYPKQYKCFNSSSIDKKIQKVILPLAKEKLKNQKDLDEIQAGLDSIYFSGKKTIYNKKLTGDLLYDYVFYRIKNHFDPKLKAPLDFPKLFLKETKEIQGYYHTHVILYDSIFFKNYLNVSNYKKTITKLIEIIPSTIKNDLIDLASEILIVLAHVGHTHSAEYKALNKFIKNYKFDSNAYWDHTNIVYLLAKIELEYQSFKISSVKTKLGVIKTFSYGDLTHPKLIIGINGGPGWSHDVLLPTNLIARKIPILYYDQLGTGNSSKNEKINKEYNLKTAVDNLDKIISDYPKKDIILLGHSWGSMVAYEYAKKFPKKVHSLILASAILKSELWKKEAVRLINNLNIKKKIKNDFFKRKISTKNYQVLLDEYNSKHVIKDATSHQYLLESFNDKIYKRLWGAAEFDFTGELKNYNGLGKKILSMPTLLIHGEFDTADHRSNLIYKKYFKNAQVKLVKDSTHSFYLRKNGDFINMLDSFLSK